MAKTYTVFIVDDEVDITLNLKGIINKVLSNPIIKTIHSFASAKQVLSSSQPDILFLDINLGDGSGFDILDILSSSNQNKSVIIMMSAFATEKEIDDAKANGVNAFLQKPFTKEKVISCVSNILNKAN